MQADKDKFTSATGFLRKKEHPVSKWILHQMNRVEDGFRPLKEEAGCAPVYAHTRKLHLMAMGRGTESKFLFSVLQLLKADAADVYARRGDPKNADALTELSPTELQALERAFQNTLDTWYTSTEQWMARCNAQQSVGGSPEPLTKSEANARCLLHWEGFTYARPKGQTESRSKKMR